MECGGCIGKRGMGGRGMGDCRGKLYPPKYAPETEAVIYIAAIWTWPWLRADDIAREGQRERDRELSLIHI